jgi:hypothetical protein
MAVRGQLYVEVACPKGTAPAVARFYRELLGCTVVLEPTNDDDDDDQQPAAASTIEDRRIDEGFYVGRNHELGPEMNVLKHNYTLRDLRLRWRATKQVMLCWSAAASGGFDGK